MRTWWLDIHALFSSVPLLPPRTSMCTVLGCPLAFTQMLPQRAVVLGLQLLLLLEKESALE